MCVINWEVEAAEGELFNEPVSPCFGSHPVLCRREETRVKVESETDGKTGRENWNYI
jgi:hypothetical protein